MDIWTACRDAVVPKRLEGELIRLVENQEQIATNALVDSLEEQSLLEEMLETSKPPVHPQAAHLHYLLATPFRYPPLRHGSRFGTRYEPSLFYGAGKIDAALAETAYYRLVFWYGMTASPPEGKLTTELTAFGASYVVNKGLCLQEPPFHDVREQLTNPGDYSDTQLLGRKMRKAGIEAFEYTSARDPGGGINIALFHPDSFSHPKPVWQEPWICETGDEHVSFYNKSYGSRHYKNEQFFFDGELPAPAV